MEDDKVHNFETNIVWDSRKHTREENKAILGFDPGEPNEGPILTGKIVDVDKEKGIITISTGDIPE